MTFQKLYIPNFYCIALITLNRKHLMLPVFYCFILSDVHSSSSCNHRISVLLSDSAVNENVRHDNFLCTVNGGFVLTQGRNKSTYALIGNTFCCSLPSHLSNGFIRLCTIGTSKYNLFNLVHVRYIRILSRPREANRKVYVAVRLYIFS